MFFVSSFAAPLEIRVTILATILVSILSASCLVAAAGALSPVFVPPSNVAEIFLPGTVSTSAHEFGLAVTSDWSEIYFTRLEGDHSFIFETHRTIATWSVPVATDFSSPTGAGHPWLAPDESQLYFISRRTCIGAAQALNVWITERTADGWSLARSLGRPVTGQTVHAPAVSATGTIYASGLIRLDKTESGYSKPEKLQPDITGSHPAIAPDESFLVFSARREGGHGGKDLYVTFARDDGSWNDPLNLGPGVNTESGESSPTFSSDGTALFFSRRGSIWWVSSNLIHRLRSQAD